MAYNCSGTSHVSLIKNLTNNGVIKSPRVQEAMMKVDRGHFVRSSAYIDVPRGIGYGVTISAPHMHALSLDLLADHLVDGAKALDVGSGSGYLTACMAIMCGPCGKAVGIDHMDGLIELSKENLKKDPFLQELVDSHRLQIVLGDGRLGYEPSGLYNAIHVGAAAAEIPPALIDQLAPGGRLVIPVGVQNQILVQIDKAMDGTTVTKTPKMGVIFVPLTSAEKQRQSCA